MSTADTALPPFDLPMSGGGRFRRSDLAGQRTVLYFYPKDNTSGCTLEGREFSLLLPQFAALGIRVLGVSPDSPDSHDQFIESCDLSVPLVSDEDRALCQALGVWVEKSMYGRTYMGVERSTFVVDGEGVVTHEWRGVKPSGHAAAVLAALSADPR